MKQIALLSMFCLAAALPSLAQTTPVSLASPLMGTDSSNKFSHGNTVPEVGLPWPVNAWSAYTQPQKDSFYYNYRAPKIRGIRQTHQPSPKGPKGSVLEK